MADTTKEITKHGEQIKHLKEKQDRTEEDLGKIKDSINNLDKNVALFAQTMTKVITDSKKRDDAFREQYLDFTRYIEDRSDVTQEIYAELQEIKASQEIMYTKITSKNTEQDKEIKEIRKEISQQRKEFEIETKRLGETIDTYVNKTQFDWLETFNEGIQTVLKKSVELGVVGIIAYWIMRLKEKLL